VSLSISIFSRLAHHVFCFVFSKPSFSSSLQIPALLQTSSSSPSKLFFFLAAAFPGIQATLPHLFATPKQGSETKQFAFEKQRPQTATRKQQQEISNKNQKLKKHTHTKNRFKTNKQTNKKEMWPGACLQSQFCQKTKP